MGITWIERATIRVELAPLECTYEIEFGSCTEAYELRVNN